MNTMKKMQLFILGILLSNMGFPQSQACFNYQAILRDTDGKIISNEQVQIKISILVDTGLGNIIYSEEHALFSNSNGLINLNIGCGDVISGELMQ